MDYNRAERHYVIGRLRQKSEGRLRHDVVYVVFCFGLERLHCLTIEKETL